MRPCVSCKKTKEIKSRGRCGACYAHDRRGGRSITPAKRGPCSECGKRAEKIVRGRCHTCYTRYLSHLSGVVERAPRFAGPCRACGKKDDPNPYRLQLCGQCYSKSRRPIHRPKPPKPVRRCLDCSKELAETTAGDYCTKHWRRHLPDRGLCLEEGCEQPVKYKGRCYAHYNHHQYISRKAVSAPAAVKPKATSTARSGRWIERSDVTVLHWTGGRQLPWTCPDCGETIVS